MNRIWSRVAAQRIGRRRALAVTGGATLGGAVLVACGGDGGDGKGDNGGLLTAPVDASKRAKQGGVHRWYQTQDPVNMDPHFASDSVLKRFAYDNLVQEIPGHLKQEENVLGAQVAESWEFSPDLLQLTLKLRPGVKWHNKPPVNGRVLDMEDVLFSWDRLARISPRRGAIANVVNPDAPIQSVAGPDQRTVVIKLKEPRAYILSLLAYSTPGGFFMIPKETDKSFDIRRDMLGTGPFYLEKYTPSVSLTLKRNQEFYDKSQGPYVDTVEMPIIPEYATALAQFKAGNLDTYEVRAEDILIVKREASQIDVFQSFDYVVDGFRLSFGYLPGSPFHDERVRQAASIALDREAWINAFNNVDKFQAEGLAVNTRWSSHVSASQSPWWLDPESKEFGPNAKYFQFNLPEAKKLMAAAGYANGLDVLSTVPAPPGYGSAYDKRVETIEGMVREVGFRPRPNQVDRSTVFIPQVRDSRGRFEGWTHKPSQSPVPEPSAVLESDFHSKSAEAFHGFDADGKGDAAGDSQLDAILERTRGEFDRDKRKAIVHDAQRYLAKKMYFVFWPGGATYFKMAWPALKNFNVFIGGSRQQGPTASGAYYFWIDENLPPYR